MNRKFLNTVDPDIVEVLIVSRRDDNLVDAMISAFVWEDAPQGFNYWENRYFDLMDGKPLSKTAKRHLQRILNQRYRLEDSV